jgi:hypothetical protein
MHAMVNKLNPHAHSPAAVKMNEINPKYEKTRKIHRLLTNQKIQDSYIRCNYLINYTFYKNPGFWLVNSRCNCRVFSYLGLISFIFTAVGVFAWGFNLFPLCAVVFAKTYFTFLPSRASNRQIHSEYFFFTFIRKVTWLIKFETRKCSDVNVFHIFTLTCLKPPN